MCRFSLGYSKELGSVGDRLMTPRRSHLLVVVVVTQSNHVVMDVSPDKPNSSWFRMQLNATCNIEKSYFNDWFTGHLNFQIEHQ